MFISKLQLWLEKRPPLIGYAKVTAYTRRISKYSRIDETQALSLILKNGNKLIKLCKNKKFITTSELTQTLNVFKKSGAITSLRYWGLPVPLLDGRYHRKNLYKAEDIINWIKNIKETRDKNETK